jgi:Zn-dependent protease with chaperone function
MIVFSTLLFQGLVAALWLAGLRFTIRPMAPLTWMLLLLVVIVLPPICVFLSFVGILPVPETWALLRISLWQDAAYSLGWFFAIPFGVLLLGTTGIFVAQELLPTLLSSDRLARKLREVDARLDESLARINVLAEGKGVGKRIAHLKIYRLNSQQPLAALHGLMRPVVLVSDGLLRRLKNDAELDAVVAHEAAHLIAGGNRTFVLVWIFRSVQAFNPLTLVAWRSLILARELAADQLAVEITGQPLDLASALLQRYGSNGDKSDFSFIARTRREITRRAQVSTTRLRVGELLGQGHRALPVPVSLLLAVLLLGGILLWVR